MAKKDKNKKAEEDEDDFEEDNSEEEDFEDDENDDWEEKKPEKKKQTKTNKGRVVKWIIAFVIILALLIFIRLKYSPTETQVNKVDLSEKNKTLTASVEEKIKPADTTNAQIETKKADEPKTAGKDLIDIKKSEALSKLITLDVTEKPKLIYNVECNRANKSDSKSIKYISLRIYNVLNEDIKISPRGVAQGYNTYLKVRGLIDNDPGCGTELLKKGQWTECTKIGLEKPFQNIDGVNRVSITVPGKTEAILVDC